jgi:uncharacterized protein YkwD
MRLLNEERAARGLRPVQTNEALRRAAYLHSKDMAQNNYFSHTSQDGRTLRDRVQEQGYTGWTRIAENIAWHSGNPDALRVFNMWKGSSDHYRNMTGNYNEAGFGHYTYNNRTYYTVDLGYRNK